MLKDLAGIDIKEAVEYTKINANGKEALLIAVIKQPNANLVTLSTAMESKIDELRKILPKGVAIEPILYSGRFCQYIG